MGFRQQGLFWPTCVATNDRVRARLPGLALSVSYCGAATCPELGCKWEVTGSPQK
jgi:hypothetical protein